MAGEDQNFHGIDNKSVSRKHLVITVDKVELIHFADDAIEPSTNLRSRSKLSIQESSKLGSVIDGVKVVGGSAVLSTKPEHAIQLGNYPPVLRIKWLPVVVSLASLSKAQKTKNAGFRAICEKLEPRDIKISSKYEPGITTHVIAAKRNVPAVLEGLTQGCYITTDKYLDALITATAPEANACPLESDFDANWPDPMKYVTPAGKEPNPRPAEMLAPKPERSFVFAGYTFVFCTTAQFESLHAPISCGGGKVFLYSHYESQAEADPKDLVAFVKNVAGEKGLGELEDGSEGKGVVVVRVTAKADNEDYVTNFMQQSDLMLGQRSVLQNEFLDAILSNDASNLRRPLLPEDIPSSTQATRPSRGQLPVENQHLQTHYTRSRTEPPTTSRASPPISQEANAEPEDTQQDAKSLRRRLRLGQVKSRFKGFDDFESPATLSAPAAIVEESSNDVFMDDADGGAPSNPRNTWSTGLRSHDSVTTQSRKRAAPPLDESNVFDSLLPAAASMKRRRIAEGVEPQLTSTFRDTVLEVKTPMPPKLFRKTNLPKRTDEDLDFLEAARQRREKEEEQRRIEEESLKEALDGIDLKAVRENIELGEIKVRAKSRGAQNKGQLNDRWDERWNGRKNFKKFRAKNAGPQPLRGHRVIVRLEEVKKKDLGTESWGEASEQRTNDQDDASIVEDDMDVSTVKGSKKGAKRTTLSMTTAAKGRKRGADDDLTLSATRLAKRGKVTEHDPDEDGSGGSEDELRFKFSRRKRA